MELQFDELESAAGLLRHVQARHVDVPARNPSGAAGTSRSSRSTTTSSSRRTCSRGGSAHRFADRAPRRRARRRRAWSTGSTTASATTRSGSTRSSAGRMRGAQLRAGALRRDAAGRVGHRRPRPRHGPQRRVRVAQLPVVARRASPGQRYQLGVSDPELALAVVRAANDWHLEEWAGTHPGPHHPVPGAVAARSRSSARRRSVATPRVASTPSRSPSSPNASGLPSLHTGYWDPFMAACAETGTVVCLHVGLVVDRADHVVGRAVRHHRRAVLRLGDVRGRRLAVLEDPGALPRPADLPVGGRASAGSPACSTGSTTSAATSRCTAPGRASTSRRAR